MPSFGNVVRSTGLKGKDAMKLRIQKAALRVPSQLANGMRIELGVERNEAEKRTPFLTGALRKTLRVEGPFFEGKRIVFKLLAGNDEVFYAWIVHEDPDAYHPIGQWKYIESVLMESANYMAARVGSHIDLRKAVE